MNNENTQHQTTLNLYYFGMSERYLSNCAKVVADAATETIRDHILFLGEYLEKLENVYSAITNRPSMTWLLLSLPF